MFFSLALLLGSSFVILSPNTHTPTLSHSQAQKHSHTDTQIAGPGARVWQPSLGITVESFSESEPPGSNRTQSVGRRLVWSGRAVTAPSTPRHPAPIAPLQMLHLPAVFYNLCCLLGGGLTASFCFFCGGCGLCKLAKLTFAKLSKNFIRPAHPLAQDVALFAFTSKLKFTMISVTKGFYSYSKKGKKTSRGIKGGIFWSIYRIYPSHKVFRSRIRWLLARIWPVLSVTWPL